MQHCILPVITSYYQQEEAAFIDAQPIGETPVHLDVNIRNATIIISNPELPPIFAKSKYILVVPSELTPIGNATVYYLK